MSFLNGDLLFGVLGEERIITVLNTAYGKQEDLPFDLRQRRAIGYYLPKKLKLKARVVRQHARTWKIDSR